MKKLTIILTSLFMVTTLAACNQSKESDISKALKELRAGVALKGQVKQVAQKLTGQHGALTGEQNENIFDLDIAYQTDGENGYKVVKILEEADRIMLGQNYEELEKVQFSASRSKAHL